jgi:AraC-like DNA-binding protein
MKNLPPFVSNQVESARRYFLNLAAKRDGPLRVVCGGIERTRSDYHIERETFPYHCLEFVAEGNGMFERHHRTEPISAGSVLCYSPSTPHRISGDGAGSMLKYYVDFVGAESSILLNQAGFSERITRRVAEPAEITDLFEGLHRDAESDHPLAEEVCACRLRLLLLKLGAMSDWAGDHVSQSEKTFREAKAWFLARGGSAPRISEAAEAIGVTPEHLSRLFKRYAQTTPHRYVERIRMQRALELLVDHGLKVIQVSELLGFTDQFHFSRSFKRVHGRPPTTFLRALGG